MTHSEMFGKANWIGVDDNVQTPYIRAEFSASDCQNAEILKSN